MINEKEIKKAIETLKAQNANGELDQVIENLESQLTTSSAVNILLEEWNLTQDEYDEVCNAFHGVRSGNNNPFDTDFQMNDNQLKFLAHLIAEYKDYYVDDWDDRIESPMDYDELYDEIVTNAETYFDIDSKISDEFAVVSEEDIYGYIKANQE